MDPLNYPTHWSLCACVLSRSPIHICQRSRRSLMRLSGVCNQRSVANWYCKSKGHGGSVSIVVFKLTACNLTHGDERTYIHIHSCMEIFLSPPPTSESLAGSVLSRNAPQVFTSCLVHKKCSYVPVCIHTHSLLAACLWMYHTRVPDSEMFIVFQNLKDLYIPPRVDTSSVRCIVCDCSVPWDDCHKAWNSTMQLERQSKRNHSSNANAILV